MVIKNFPAVKNSFHTVTVLFTQKGSAPSAGAGNTMDVQVFLVVFWWNGELIFNDNTKRSWNGFATDAGVGDGATQQYNRSSF